MLPGANSGIGRDAARKFSKLGHNVYVACRTEARAKQAAKETGRCRKGSQNSLL